MASFDTPTPATTRRAFLIGAVLACVLRAAAPVNAPAPLAQIGKPDAAEAARLLEQFRQAGIAGDYYLAFELHHFPRRGDESVFRGQLWGGRNATGAVERIVLVGGDGQERRFLLQHGDRAAVWRQIGSRAEPLPVAALLDPLVPGVEITPFDLQMPFLYWPGATVERVVRTLGRPSHEFWFTPPADFAASHAEIGFVRSFFDTQFNVPVRTELLGRDRGVLKSLAIVDLKKVGDQWLVKSLDVRDERTRDKTRLLFTGAALQLALPASAFDPAALGSVLAPPAKDHIVSLAP